MLLKVLNYPYRPLVAKNCNIWKSGAQNRLGSGVKHSQKFLKIGIHDLLIKLHYLVGSISLEMSGVTHLMVFLFFDFFPKNFFLSKWQG